MRRRRRRTERCVCRAHSSEPGRSFSGERRAREKSDSFAPQKPIDWKCWAVMSRVIKHELFGWEAGRVQRRDGRTGRRWWFLAGGFQGKQETRRIKAISVCTRSALKLTIVDLKFWEKRPQAASEREWARRANAVGHFALSKQRFLSGLLGSHAN